jgi:large subunit ribosomal protein L9
MQAIVGLSVRPGYGRNYLIPQGKAVEANPHNLARFEARRAELEKKAQEALTRAQARREQLADLEITLSVKAGAEGRLFGSVSAADIANAVSAAGIELHKHEIHMPEGPVRQLGEYEIPVHLHADINTQIRVNVIAE